MTNINMKELAKKVVAENSWGDVKLISSSETNFVLEHFGAEYDDEKIHRTEVEYVNYGDETEIIDVLRIVEGTPVYHLVIVIKDESEWDTSVQFPYGFIDINSQFSGDVDCGIVSVLYDHIPGMSWRKVEDRTVTLCDKLDHVIRQAQQPSFEEAIHKIIDAAIAEGPENWDDDEDKDA